MQQWYDTIDVSQGCIKSFWHKINTNFKTGYWSCQDVKKHQNNFFINLLRQLTFFSHLNCNQKLDKNKIVVWLYTHVKKIIEKRESETLNARGIAIQQIFDFTAVLRGVCVCVMSSIQYLSFVYIEYVHPSIYLFISYIWDRREGQRGRVLKTKHQRLLDARYGIAYFPCPYIDIKYGKEKNT